MILGWRFHSRQQVAQICLVTQAENAFANLVRPFGAHDRVAEEMKFLANFNIT